MKRNNSNVKYSRLFLSQKGFTLIEFLSVFSIIAILSAVSIASFSSFNNTQIFQSSSAEFIALLNLAKSRSLAQIKPPACGAQTLRGYQVVLIPPGPGYRLEALCGASPVVVVNNNLGSGVTFGSSSTSIILFAAATGTSNPSTVILNGHGRTTTVRTDSVGTISTQ